MLIPTLCTYNPSAVFFSIREVIMIHTAATTIGVGINPRYPPKILKESSLTYTIILLHNNRPIALAAENKISVATIGCTFRYDTKNPLNAPQTHPIRIPPSTPMISGLASSFVEETP